MEEAKGSNPLCSTKMMTAPTCMFVLSGIIRFIMERILDRQDTPLPEGDWQTADLNSLRVEGDVGGPTSVYDGSLYGIAQVVRAYHNLQTGKPIDTGLERVPKDRRIIKTSAGKI